MHILEAAAAAALFDRRPAERIAQINDDLREGTRGLARLALALVAVAALFVTLGAASPALSPAAGPQVAIERSN
jgi:hypothetical protein